MRTPVTMSFLARLSMKGLAHRSFGSLKFKLVEAVQLVKNVGFAKAKLFFTVKQQRRN